VDWRPQVAAVSGTASPWRVELELPGDLTLRICGEWPDSHQARP
jgi:hypothetical protein